MWQRQRQCHQPDGQHREGHFGATGLAHRGAPLANRPQAVQRNQSHREGGHVDAGVLNQRDQNADEVAEGPAKKENIFGSEF